jgi:hypothetical protein
MPKLEFRIHPLTRAVSDFVAPTAQHLAVSLWLTGNAFLDQGALSPCQNSEISKNGPSKIIRHARKTSHRSNMIQVFSMNFFHRSFDTGSLPHDLAA